jgi:glutamate-5-semialdehyde dehydrogenase
MRSIEQLLEAAKPAARVLKRLDLRDRNQGLLAMAAALDGARKDIQRANQEDMEHAQGLSEALRDRLLLTDGRVDGMIRALKDVAAQPDPLGSVREIGKGRSGVRVTRRRIPLGVVAIVYEARPNVTAECAALTVKSGNVVVLRGGKEAKESNQTIAAALRSGLRTTQVPEDAVLFLEDTNRAAVRTLLGAVGQVDLIIPRGGASLMAMVDEFAKVPVIRHGEGICQVYVDETADPAMAANIAFNAKVQRPGVCNAMETLLLHREQVIPVLSQLGPRLRDAGVEIRADASSLAALETVHIAGKPSSDTDYDTEFLDLVLAIRAVDTLDEALDHIAAHGTHHTAAIVTEDSARAERFLGDVDASCVLWNASTRLNDGGELGLGAEMGISTSKMHAYGPMSATELTAEKLVVYGTGQVRS